MHCNFLWINSPSLPALTCSIWRWRFTRQRLAVAVAVAKVGAGNGEVGCTAVVGRATVMVEDVVVVC